MFTFVSTWKFDKEASILLIDQLQLERKKLVWPNESVKSAVIALHKAGHLSGENGELYPFLLNNKLLLLAGIGKSSDTSLSALRVTVRKAFLSSYISKAKEIELVAHDQDPKVIQAVLEGIAIGGYAWKKYLAKDKNDRSVDFKNKKISIVAAKNKIYDDTLAVCQGVNFARDLVNDNADTVTSVFIEKAIRTFLKGKSKLQLKILNQKELKAQGLNLHLAVNQGSRNEPKLIIVKYAGGLPKDPYVALIGKGITFDTGGLNLKPTGSIETMRCDMSGLAAVAGTLKNTLALGMKRNILFVFGIAENVTGSGSYKPGDVFRGYSGKTVEIGNTDAEGRLVLADAIAYVVKNYKPAWIIDIATLTGACVIALGHDYSGLVSNHDQLAEQLLNCAQATDDRVWRLPNYPEIKHYVKSLIADIKNVGLPKGAAGACTAAEFLRQFTNDTKWAHLDIAGTAFVDGHHRMYFGHGATGAGVRLLTYYLQNIKS